MGFKLWFAINFDYFAQPFTDFHEIWRSFFNNTSQYCFTQEASQQNHFIYSLHCLFTWHSVVKWFCHVKNKSIWSYSVLMFCLSFNAICKKIYHINFLFYFWNVITHILMLCAFAKYAMCTIFHATIIYVCVDVSFICFIHSMQRSSGNVVLEHLQEQVFKNFSRLHPAMVNVPIGFYSFSRLLNCT